MHIFNLCIRVAAKGRRLGRDCSNNYMFAGKLGRSSQVCFAIGPAARKAGDWRVVRKLHIGPPIGERQPNIGLCVRAIAAKRAA